MAENSAISWTDHTWNPWIGCTKVSPACDGCYAENLMATRYGRVEWGAPGKGAGTRVRTGKHTWHDPFRWHRKAEQTGARPFVFCASLADIFDNQVDPAWRRDAFDVIRETPRNVYLLLTKRPQLIVKLAEAAGGLPRNAAIGTTVEDQERTINLFRLAIAARETSPLFTFASFEPLLGRVDPTRIIVHEGPASFVDYPNIDTVRMTFDALRGAPSIRLPALGWAITGGETDQGAHKARPTHPDWFRSLRDQCAAAGVPYHHKQNGEWHTKAYQMGSGQAVFRQFDTFQHWVNKASTWVNGGICLDACGQQMKIGADFLRARDESTFPVTVMHRAGKKAAGRLLDGVEHNARPLLSDWREQAA